MIAAIIIALIVLAVVFFIAELILPTGGLLGLGGVLCILGLIVACFVIDKWLGFSVMLGTLLVTPFVLTWFIKYYPRTRMGKKLILTNQEPSIVRPPPLHIGQEGVAVSRLTPSGEAEFNNERIEVIAEQGMIDAGQPLRVVSFINGRPAVRQITV